MIYQAFCQTLTLPILQHFFGITPTAQPLSVYYASKPSKPTPLALDL